MSVHYLSCNSSLRPFTCLYSLLVRDRKLPGAHGHAHDDAPAVPGPAAHGEVHVRVTDHPRPPAPPHGRPEPGVS